MMKRRLAYLVLSIVLAFSALSLFSCSDDEIDTEDIELADDNTRAAVSLNFFIITDARTTDEARLKMQDAFNAYSELEFRTHVEFIMCTADEYAEMMEERFAAIENGEVQVPGEIDTTQGAVEYYIDELGQQKVKYPEIEEGQIDIVLVTGKEMLTDYVSAGRLLDLTEKLDGDFKVLRSYINTDLYSSVALDGRWYSVPNNKVLGSYTYLFVNKQVADFNHIGPAHFSTAYGAHSRTAWNFNNIKELLKGTQAMNNLKAQDPNNEKLKDYEPLIPLYSTFDFPTTEFWMEDGSTSIYATFYDANTKHGDYVTVINPFGSNIQTDENYLITQSYVDYLKLMLDNQTYGYDQAPEGAKDFAVAVMEGDYGLRHKYEENYLCMILDTPRLEEDDMFESMLAVSSYTRSSDRAMEIISQLTTNQELRNILLYGEEGTHFSYDEVDGKTVVNRLNSDYLMSLDHTGNAFMAYPCMTDEQSPTVWEEGMIQNNEALRSPTYGFTAADMWETLETSLIDFQTVCLIRPMLNDKNGYAGPYQHGQGVTDLALYIESLESLYFEQLYPALAKAIDKGNPVSEEELAVARAQVSTVVAARVEELRVQAVAIATGVVSDAKTYSATYMERINACETSEELVLEIESIREEMAKNPLFSNGDTSNGTPFGLYEKEFISRSPKFTLAGALLNWRLGIAD